MNGFERASFQSRPTQNEWCPRGFLGPWGKFELTRPLWAGMQASGTCGFWLREYHSSPRKGKWKINKKMRCPGFSFSLSGRIGGGNGSGHSKKATGTPAGKHGVWWACGQFPKNRFAGFYLVVMMLGQLSYWSFFCCWVCRFARPLGLRPGHPIDASIDLLVISPVAAPFVQLVWVPNSYYSTTRVALCLFLNV